MLELRDLVKVDDGRAAHVASMAKSSWRFWDLVEFGSEQDAVKVMRVSIPRDGSSHRAPRACG